MKVGRLPKHLESQGEDNQVAFCPEYCWVYSLDGEILGFS